MTTRVLVTGGAGFIGQAVVDTLVKQGFMVTVVDRRPSMYISQLHDENKLHFIKSDYADLDITDTVLDGVDYIIHLAASHQVGESVNNASSYYDNNVIKFKELLDAAVSKDIKGVIFSGSSSVYGDNSTLCTCEDTLFDPTSPYASTKAVAEYMLRDYNMSYGLPYISLRYFNAAGADPELKFGYEQDFPTHLIPCLIDCVVNDNPFYINGTDYDTEDGTVIRSYTHVMDIAEAHVLAIKHMDNNKGTADTFNIGHSNALSVKQVSDVAKGLYPTLKVVNATRRPGDSEMQSADNSKSRSTLGWQTAYNINDMLIHEYNYQRKKHG